MAAMAWIILSPRSLILSLRAAAVGVEGFLFTDFGASSLTVSTTLVDTMGAAVSVFGGGAAFANSLTINMSTASSFDMSQWQFGDWQDDDRIIVNGTAGNDTVVGTSRNDVLSGDAGEDTLTGGAGDDTLDGGTGDIDTARFWDARANYTITQNPDGSWQVAHTGFNPANAPGRISDGIDTLYSIGQAQFADQVSPSSRSPRPALRSSWARQSKMRR